MKSKLNSFLSSQLWVKIWDSMWWIGYISVILFITTLTSCSETNSSASSYEVHFRDGTKTVIQSNTNVRLTTDACILNGFDVLACNVTYFKKIN